MPKRNKDKFLYFLLSIGLVLIVMGGIKYIPGLQAVGSVVFDDYIDYDDRINPGWNNIANWEGPSNQKDFESDLWTMYVSNSVASNRCSTATTTINLIDDKLTITGTTCSYESTTQTGSSGYAIANQDFKGKDLKITVTTKGGWTYCCPNVGMSSNQVIIGDEIITVTPFTPSTVYSGSVPTTTTIEMFSSKLDSNIADIHINGVYDRTVDFTGVDKVNIKFTVVKGDTLVIDRFAYKIPFSCQQGPEELLGLETFVGPRTLSIYDLRYGPTKFCVDHPAILTRESEAGSTTSAEIYQRLARGEVMNIPEGDTWTVMYIFYNDGSIGQVCDEETFDITRNKCTNLTGITYFCSEGVWDSEKGTCLVTPGIEEECEIGRYDIDQDVCLYNPPEQALCEIGNYNSQTELCEYRPQTGISCDLDYFYDSNIDLCVKEPLAKINCPANYSFNPISGYCEGEGQSTPIVDECPEGFIKEGDVCRTKPPIISTFRFSESLIGLAIGIALTLFVLFILFTNPKKR